VAAGAPARALALRSIAVHRTAQRETRQREGRRTARQDRTLPRDPREHQVQGERGQFREFESSRQLFRGRAGKLVPCSQRSRTDSRPCAELSKSLPSEPVTAPSSRWRARGSATGQHDCHMTWPCCRGPTRGAVRRRLTLSRRHPTGASEGGQGRLRAVLQRTKAASVGVGWVARLVPCARATREAERNFKSTRNAFVMVVFD
jgi:hypothetical protein